MGTCSRGVVFVLSLFIVGEILIYTFYNYPLMHYFHSQNSSNGTINETTNFKSFQHTQSPKVKNIFEKFSARNCGYITISLDNGMSGLGNRMWVYASFFGIAKTTNKIPLIFQKEDLFELHNFFKLSPPRVFDMFDISKFATHNPDYGSCCKFHKSLTEIPCGVNFRVYGFRQSWKYFADSNEEVRKEFQFVDDINEHCEEIIQDIVEKFNTTRQNSILVGAHMRRGDFLQGNFAGFGFVAATQVYLENAVVHFENRFNESEKTLIFVILGNDYEWNLKNVPIRKNLVVIKPNNRTLDLCILSKCNHMIMSSGTYSWWAAFLSAGETTYMKDQCRPGSGLCNEMTFTDYINPAWNWVPLPY